MRTVEQNMPGILKLSWETAVWDSCSDMQVGSSFRHPKSDKALKTHTDTKLLLLLFHSVAR